MTKSCDFTKVPEGMSQDQKQRAVHANKVYCKACEENGIKICSWNSLPAWKEYVDGRIGEAELSERAQSELKHFTDSFGKYTVIKEEEEAPAARDDTRLKERAKAANRIYKDVCSSSGQSHCFFKNFATWSEYVRGDMDEAEFQERARQEAAKMAEGN